MKRLEVSDRIAARGVRKLLEVEVFHEVTGFICLTLWCTAKPSGKALAYGGVPGSMTGMLSAKEWVGAALAVVGGKGGGKDQAAQGQGTLIDRVPDAMELAASFAAAKL